MARRRRKPSIRKSTRRKTRFLHVTPKPLTPRIRRTVISKRVRSQDLSKRTLSINTAKTEVKAVRRRMVIPKYSKLSPLNCAKKRAERRRDYFAMKASGAGPRVKLKHDNRFTVRC